MKLTGNRGTYQVDWLWNRLAQDKDIVTKADRGLVHDRYEIEVRGDNLFAVSAILAARKELAPLKDTWGWVAPFLTNGGSLNSLDSVHTDYLSHFRGRTNDVWTYALDQARTARVLDAKHFKTTILVTEAQDFFAVRKRAYKAFHTALDKFLHGWKVERLAPGLFVDAPDDQDGLLKGLPNAVPEPTPWVLTEGLLCSAHPTLDNEVLALCIEDPKRKGRLSIHWVAVYRPDFIKGLGLNPGTWKDDIYREAIAYTEGGR